MTLIKGSVITTAKERGGEREKESFLTITKIKKLLFKIS